MEERIKEIISIFIHIPVSEITGETRLDRSAVGNSIKLHRMYAKIAEAGFPVSDYGSIVSYSQLIRRIEGASQGTEIDYRDWRDDSLVSGDYTPGLHIGVDVENIAALPRVADFREDVFYIQNFSPEEIAYCICQPDPYTSFAGLFAAKEAIVKADSRYKAVPFNKIVIDHLDSGKPVTDNFNLSISHTDLIAVAVALQVDAVDSISINNNSDVNAIPMGSGNRVIRLAIAALVLSLIALVLVLLR